MFFVCLLKDFPHSQCGLEGLRATELSCSDVWGAGMCLSKRKDAGKCIRSAFNALELRCHKKTELKPFYKKEPLKLKGSPETWWCEIGDTKKNRCFGTRILSALHLGTLQIPRQNRKGHKNAKLDAQLNPQNASIVRYLLSILGIQLRVFRPFPVWMGIC